MARTRFTPGTLISRRISVEPSVVREREQPVTVSRSPAGSVRPSSHAPPDDGVDTGDRARTQAELAEVWEARGTSVPSAPVSAIA